MQKGKKISKNRHSDSFATANREKQLTMIIKKNHPLVVIGLKMIDLCYLNTGVQLQLGQRGTGNVVGLNHPGHY